MGSTLRPCSITKRWIVRIKTLPKPEWFQIIRRPGYSDTERNTRQKATQTIRGKHQKRNEVAIRYRTTNNVQMMNEVRADDRRRPQGTARVPVLVSACHHRRACSSIIVMQNKYRIYQVVIERLITTVIGIHSILGHQ